MYLQAAARLTGLGGLVAKWLSGLICWVQAQSDESNRPKDEDMFHL